MAVNVLVEAARGLGMPQGMSVTAATRGRTWFRVYLADDGFAIPNPGFGDTRFAPFDDASGNRVEAMYVAEQLEGALLETVLRNVGVATPRMITETDLLGRLQVAMIAPRDLLLADLRDAALSNLGVDRGALATSSAEHYPCTRAVAKAVHACKTPDGSPIDGIVWHSRQAELSGRPPQEVAVLFGPNAPMGRASWEIARARGSSGALIEGAGRDEFDRLANQLGVTVMRDLPGA
ncbi:RES family NAD+ phosphorylase [Nocardioides sp.]|uniref:RES family NAD+ phosphorylase n=1 Tax=Nocardioides sp. TaxID=35761 RepID=UPI00321B41FF